MTQKVDNELTESAREDEQLIRACRQGDVQAWQRLLDKYERLVFSIARNAGLEPEDATDITQQTFSFLIQSLETMRDEGNLGGWLATVARRHSRRLLVRQRNYEAKLADPQVATSLLPTQSRAETIEHWELTEWLHSGLQHLDERCRDLLMALYFDPQEPSYADIAARLGMAEGSIGATRARCLARLRIMLS